MSSTNSLHTTAPFLGLNADKLDFDELIFKKDQIIYCEGSTSLGAYFVKKGKVKVKKTGSGGKEQIIRIAVPGDLINFTEIITEMKFSSTSQALEDTTVLFLEKKIFQKLINTQNKTCDYFMQLLSKELSEAECKIADMAYKPVKARLADTLVELIKRYNKEDYNNNKVSILISRKDLAGYTGTAKETVNRLLSDFKKEKLISTSGTTINVLDLNGLKTINKLHN